MTNQGGIMTIDKDAMQSIDQHIARLTTQRHHIINTALENCGFKQYDYVQFFQNGLLTKGYIKNITFDYSKLRIIVHVVHIDFKNNFYNFYPDIQLIGFPLPCKALRTIPETETKTFHKEVVENAWIMEELVSPSHLKEWKKELFHKCVHVLSNSDMWTTCQNCGHEIRNNYTGINFANCRTDVPEKPTNGGTVTCQQNI